MAPLLSNPADEEGYDALVEALDELLALVRDDENHLLASAAAIGPPGMVDCAALVHSTPYMM